jgi:crotonobetainyl-CoA:carnitine CoA-transferase CaiB-like acyl-CoA transferase
VVVVAGDDHQLAVGAERAAQVGEHRFGDRGGIALRRLAQLEPVAEDHEAVVARDLLEQRRAQLGAPQQVGRRAWSRGGGRRRRAFASALRLGSRPMTDSAGPLDGLLVADFSRVLAGPFAAMTLGDLGADVVKVERPGGGDDTRAWGPPWHGDDATYYLGLNRNKRSVALDLVDEGDRALARALGERADVLIESFRPGLMASWGLDGDALRERNPRLVSCSITAFGSSERASGLPGYDLLLQAMGGLMSVTGEADGPPLKVGAAVVDLVCGLLAVAGIEAALVERERTGAGRHVEVSLMDSALTSLLNQGSGWVAGGRGRRGAATATRASSRTRPTRPPTARSRSRSATTACSRACARRSGCPSCRRRALRHQHRARRQRRRARRGARARSSATPPPSTGSRSCARPTSRSARSTTSPRPTRSPSRSASSRSEVDGVPLARRSALAPPPAAGAPAARSTSTATRSGAWLAPVVCTGGRPRRPRSALQAVARAPAACRTVFGSMKRTSSRMTSNSETSSCRARGRSRRAADELLGRAGAGGDADDARALEPLLAHLRLVVDQVRVGAVVARDVDEAVASSTSSASRSRARGRTRAAICLTAAWRFVVA